MRNFITYCRILILSVFLMVPWAVNAQNGSTKLRAIDSLKNQISRDTSKQHLAKLNYELASLYHEIYEFAESNKAAHVAASYAKDVNDLSTQLNCYLLLGNNNIDLYNSVEALQNYMQARKVIEKRTELLQNDKSLSKEALSNFIRIDQETDADIVAQMGRVYFSRSHYERAIDCFDESKAVYDKLKIEDKSIEMKKHLAHCYSAKQDWDNAFKYYDELLKYYKEKKDWDNTKSMYQRINEVLIKKKDYATLEKYNSELFDECGKYGNPKEQLNVYNNLAYAYVCQKKYAQAAQFFENLYDYDKKVPHKDDEELVSLLATSLTNGGLCYHNMGDYDKSLDYLKRAYELRKGANQDKEAAHVANLIAHIYALHDDIHNAEYYQKLALQHAQTSDDRETVKEVYLGLNEVYSKKGDFQSAFKYYQDYLDLEKEDRDNKDDQNRKKQDELKELTDAEKNWQDKLNEADIKERQERENDLRMQQAIAAQELAEKEKESSEFKRQAAEKAAELTKAELRRAQAEKAILLEQQKQRDYADSVKREQDEQERKIRDLKDKEQQLRAEQLEKENQLNLQKGQTQMFIMLSILAGVIILFFIGFIIAMRKKNQKLKEQQAEIERANADLIMKNDEITAQKENLQAANNEILTKNEELSRQKEVIEQANKSITDSIVYAKRIQTAVCPSPNFLSMFNMQYFLFFRPRDIVSGDYYWFHADDKSIFIVAADCTGHGVPGAFMSMLGLSLFNKIVAERNITEPDEILNHLRAEVKQALHQDSINSSQKDGMDLSLVRYDIETKMLHFAAANNNGYLVQHYGKDQEEQAKANLVKPDHLRETEDGYLRLTIMPADSMPIGVYIREKESFTKTSYQLKEGDSFYLTSDGYIDQFGGKWGRKFLSKNFQKLVMDINPYDMKRQHKIVEETHDNWIGESYEQLDDIIVIGIRV